MVWKVAGATLVVFSDRISNSSTCRDSHFCSQTAYEKFQCLGNEVAEVMKLLDQAGTDT